MLRRKLLSLAGAAGLIMVLLGAPLVAPSSTLAAQGTPCAAPTDAELEAIAHAWVNIFNIHDVSIIDEIAPQNEHHSGVDGSITTAKALKASQLAIFEAYPDMQVSTNLTLTDAPFAVVQWTGTGTNTGELRGAAPTGAAATWDGFFMVRVDCGQVVESWAFIDQLGYIQETGPLSGAAEPEDSLAGADVGSPAACPTATEEEMVGLLEAWWTQGWQGDLDVLDEITADDIYHHWATGPDSIGAEAQTERISGLNAGYDELIFTWGDIVIDGEYAAAVWVADGTLGEPVPGLEPSDNALSWGGANIFRIECGQIAEVWSEMDILTLRAQLAPDDTAATPAP